MKKFVLASLIVVCFFLLHAGNTFAATESRISGQDRYKTAVEVSKKTFPKGTGTVVLARGDEFADALTSTPLAYKVNGPILLTKPNAIPDSTMAEISRLQVKNIILVGGTKAISQEVEQQLIEKGIQVERISGSDRVSTSLKIAEYLNPSHHDIYAVNQSKFPDALVIAPYAAKRNIPIILLSDSTITRADVQKYLDNVSNTFIIGGTKVVGAKVEKNVPKPIRISGASRYETATVIANRYFKGKTDMLVVTGKDFADALTGSVMAAKRDVPIILVSQDKVDNSVKSFVKKQKVNKYTIIGGKKAVDPSISKKLYSPIINKKSETLRLVTKNTYLSKNYVPKNLVVPNVRFSTTVSERKHMVKEAGTALEKLFRAANNDGIILYAQSGYRSYNTQRYLYNNYVSRYGQKEANRFSAKPGQSEHQTGLAMDVTSKGVGFQLVERFGETKEGKWVANNAAKYGFIISYPKGKERLTGYMYEPWHIRYVGVEHAVFMDKYDLTLEQYLSEY
ncbi:cell wall-binding repeat-containing protein [Bacillus timonensis]|uniref:cell wall-binding repeat-containing protein n=1 Tax=Bacillus timonensis TaxID=1033734 RepID=UPI0002880A1A|nr:cell wall-binding repeat-containing protein [Bacillus timonensis]